LQFNPHEFKGNGEAPVTISRPMVVAPPRTPKSSDAGDAVADRFPRCDPGRPCCRRHLFPPIDARGYRLPASSQSRRRSAHLLHGYPVASVPLPCSVRVQTLPGTPSQRRRPVPLGASSVTVFKVATLPKRRRFAGVPIPTIFRQAMSSARISTCGWECSESRAQRMRSPRSWRTTATLSRFSTCTTTSLGFIRPCASRQRWKQEFRIMFGASKR